MSALSAFLFKQRMRWYGRGIDRQHELRRRFAYYVAKHGFEIGDYSAGEPTVRLYCKSRLKVGNYTSIAVGAVLIIGGRHRTDTVTTSFLQRPRGIGPPDRDIVVGSDVWIAGEAVIVSGVTIGDGAVVGAGSVVIDDVPPYGVVFGNPARLVRKRFSDEIIAALLELRWWDLPRDQVEFLRPLLLSDEIEAFIDECRKVKGLPPIEKPIEKKKAVPQVANRESDSIVPDLENDDPTEVDIRAWCADFLAKRLKMPASQIDPHADFKSLGIDSMTSIIFVADLEDWLGLELPANTFFEHPTIDELAQFLTRRLAGRHPHDHAGSIGG